MAFRGKPLHDRIVVKRDTKQEKTAGGIVLPDTSQKDSKTGVVVAAGPGHINNGGVLVPNAVSVGDRIMFGAYAGTEVEIDGEKYQVMREGDVTLVLPADSDVPTSRQETVPPTGAEPEILPTR